MLSVDSERILFVFASLLSTFQSILANLCRIVGGCGLVVYSTRNEKKPFRFPTPEFGRKLLVDCFLLSSNRIEVELLMK